jgi:hypothetical protein
MGAAKHQGVDIQELVDCTQVTAFFPFKPVRIKKHEQP